MHGLLNSVTVAVPFMLHPWIDALPASLCLKILQLLCPSMTIHEWALVLFVTVMRLLMDFRVTVLIHGPFMDHLWKYTLAALAPLSTWGV